MGLQWAEITFVGTEHDNIGKERNLYPSVGKSWKLDHKCLHMYIVMFSSVSFMSVCVVCVCVCVCEPMYTSPCPDGVKT